MKGILKIDGKEIEIELTEEQTKTVNNALKPKLTGWERVRKEELYCLVGVDGEIDSWVDADNELDNACFETANYFSTEEKANEVAGRQELDRKILRFSELNNVGEMDWTNKSEYKWCIVVNEDNKLDIGASLVIRDFQQIYFTSKEIAEKALETFRPELEEYFGINQWN